MSIKGGLKENTYINVRGSRMWSFFFKFLIFFIKLSPVYEREGEEGVIIDVSVAQCCRDVRRDRLLIK